MFTLYHTVYQQLLLMGRKTFFSEVQGSIYRYTIVYTCFAYWWNIWRWNDV